jgi:uncharacterized oligopeptide transporter (OPT) family protein
MPIAVGLYLPFGLSVPIVVGGLIEWAGRRRASTESARRSQPSQPQPSQKGILFASGVVAGEALVGVGVAMLIGLGIDGPSFSFAGSGALSLAAAIGVIGIFAAACRARTTA